MCNAARMWLCQHISCHTSGSMAARSSTRPGMRMMLLWHTKTGHGHASKSRPLFLKPFANVRQASWQCTDCLALDQCGSVYGLLQRIRALTHLALLTEAVHKEPEDCDNLVGVYCNGSGLQVTPLRSCLSPCGETPSTGNVSCQKQKTCNKVAPHGMLQTFARSGNGIKGCSM